MAAAPAMQSLLHQIQDLSAKGNFIQLQNTLKAAESGLLQTAQQQGPSVFLQALQQLNALAHTFGCIALLNAWGGLGPGMQGNADFFRSASSLFKEGDARQMQLSPSATATLAGHLRDHVVAMQTPRHGIVPLTAALQKSVPSPEYITPMHAMLFQCCLLAKMPAAAIPVLEAEAYDVDPAKTGMTPRDFLLYCYYGGLIHIARKRYPEALECLLAALTAPSMVTNAIAVAAFKKWTLVNLIHNGKLPPLPRWTPVAVSRAVKLEGGPYQDLAAAYGGKSATALAEAVNKHQAEFSQVQEENAGLVKLVVDSQTKRNVQRLTQTYLTLSLPDIAAAVGLPSAQAAELAILRMVDAGEVFAEIDHEKGMVRFLEDPQQFRGAGTLARIDEQISRATALANRIAALDHEVACDRPYISKVHMKDRGSLLWRDDPAGDFGVSEPQPPSLSFSKPPMFAA